MKKRWITKQSKRELAKKYDFGKNRLELIPVYSLLELGKVYTYGAKKYGDCNYLKGMSWSRLYGAALRHLTAWASGEDVDLESGLPHLAHAMWQMASLLEYSKRGIGVDDRMIYKGGDRIGKSIKKPGRVR